MLKAWLKDLNLTPDFIPHLNHLQFLIANIEVITD